MDEEQYTQERGETGRHLGRSQAETKGVGLPRGGETGSVTVAVSSRAHWVEERGREREKTLFGKVFHGAK